MGKKVLDDNMLEKSKEDIDEIETLEE